MIPSKLENLIHNFNDADQEMIRLAYIFAKEKHLGQKRRSGSPYILHPLRVAITLAKDHYDAKTIISGLLHDTIENTETTKSEITKNFDEEIANIVDGVAEISTIKLRHKDQIFADLDEKNFLDQVDNYKKILFATTSDPRVMIVKLYDRLDNIDTVRFMPKEKIKFYARETIEIFAPIAERLGMGVLKSKLEDLAFPYAYPREYKKFKLLIHNIYKNPQETIDKITPSIVHKLTEAQIKIHNVSSRAKSQYSLYKKIQHKENIANIFDIIALRVIVDTVAECYQALGIIHSLYEPIPGQIDDYVARPKDNSYQSIHTVVRFSNDHVFEVQIRTQAMHETAEYGMAAHWNYKEKNYTGANAKNSLEWITELEKLKEVGDNKEFLGQLKDQLFSNRIFVFTPHGEIIRLPQGSSSIDFAYRIHTDVGNTCTGAKINGRIMPLSTRLKNSDVVEVITTKNSEPSIDWLKFVKTAHARQRIKSFAKEKELDQMAEIGLKKVLELAKKLKLENFNKAEAEKKISRSKLPYNSLDRALSAIGEGALTPLKLIKTFYPEIKSIKTNKPKSTINNGAWEIPSLKGMPYEFAGCCKPKKGDKIIGYINRSHELKIHKISCKINKNSDQKRIIPL